MRDELINGIIKLEWDMFSTVANVGRKAACQTRPETFAIMRRSQEETWPDALLESYRKDLERAAAEGRNLMSEKYARMMESTHPAEFNALKDRLPPVDAATLRRIEDIVAVNVAWKLDTAARFPLLNGRGRPVRSVEDSPAETSFETYLRGELKTYSPETVLLLHEFTLRQKRDGVNGVELNLCNQVKQYGYASLEEAEHRQRG